MPTRFNIALVTVQLQPSELTEADLRLPAGDFHRLTTANDRARDGKLFMHKIQVLEEKENGEQTQGLMQGSMFDADKTNGRDELRELLDALKTSILERTFEGERKVVCP